MQSNQNLNHHYRFLNEIRLQALIFDIRIIVYYIEHIMRLKTFSNEN